MSDRVVELVSRKKTEKPQIRTEISEKKDKSVRAKDIWDARLKCTIALLMQYADKGIRPPVGHLWWPKNNRYYYEFRKGNPPADVDRPPWLKKHRLVVDAAAMPQRLVDLVKAQRVVAKSPAVDAIGMEELMKAPQFLEVANWIYSRQMMPGE